MSARAEASERLSSEIVESLSSGLLVVASDGQLRILNPAGRRLLNRDGSALAKPYRTVLPAALAQLVEECLQQGEADRPPNAASRALPTNRRRIWASAYRRCRTARESRTEPFACSPI